MSRKFHTLRFAAILGWIGVAACLAILASAGNVGAQQPSDWRTTLVSLLKAHRDAPDAPQPWYELGSALSKVPGYKAPAGIWLDAYLLALPNAPNAVAIRAQVRQLQAAREPQREIFIDQLEVMALDTRATIHDRQGRRELAIADFTRMAKLDPTQNRAKEALKRLNELKAARAPDKLSPTCRAAQGDYVVVNVHWGDQDGGLVIRASPNRESAATAVIPMAGINIGVGECQSGWCRVKYGCDTGWSSANYLAQRSTQLYKVTGVSPSDREGLNIRTEPRSNSDVASAIPHNGVDIVVHVCQPSPHDQTSWCLVTYLASSGWVAGRFLTQ